MPDEPAPSPKGAMPPPSVPTTGKARAQDRSDLPHADGEILRVSGRTSHANTWRMPMVLRMKHKVPSKDLNDPTIEGLYRAFHDPSTLPVVKHAVTDLIIKLGANPDDDMNMKHAGVSAVGAAVREASPGATSAAPTEQINSQLATHAGVDAAHRWLDTHTA